MRTHVMLVAGVAAAGVLLVAATHSSAGSRDARAAAPASELEERQESLEHGPATVAGKGPDDGG